MNDPQNSKLWAAYFVLMCIFFVAGLFFGSKTAISLVNSVLTGISIVGLWGYISQKAIGNRLIWVLMFVVQLVGAIAVSAFMFLSDALPVAIASLIVAFTVPLLVALFRYAFQSSDIWRAEVAGA